MHDEATVIITMVLICPSPLRTDSIIEYETINGIEKTIII